MTESVDVEYANLYIYSLLSGSTYIELPRKLKNAMKCLINIKKMTINGFFGIILVI